MHHEHLPTAVGAGADPDRGHWDRRGDRRGHLPWDAFKHNGKGSRRSSRRGVGQ